MTSLFKENCMKRALFSGLALLTVFVNTVGFASADSGKTGPVSSSFAGTAVTGVGSPLPIDFEPWNIQIRGDGAVGIGYTYRALGEAKGEVDGSFSYEEHGYLFFMNPANPATFVGSTYVAGWFNLTPRRGNPVVIADTNPAAYTSGAVTAPVTLPRGILKTLVKIPSSPINNKGELVYGTFTFTDNYGTFTGYSTPDSRYFAIQIKFDCAGCK